MKSTIKKMFVILAIGMSLITIQSACAETIVEGTIETVSTHPNVVAVDGIDVYGVKFNYLNNQHDIVLTVNMDVSFKVYEYECSDGTTRLKACEIAVEGGNWIPLRECQ